MKIAQYGVVIAGAAVLAACASHSKVATGAGEGIFETNVTGNMKMFSGEPEITYDRTHPRNLAIVEFTLGSDARPAPAFSPDHSPGGVQAFYGRVPFSVASKGAKCGR